MKTRIRFVLLTLCAELCCHYSFGSVRGNDDTTKTLGCANPTTAIVTKVKNSTATIVQEIMPFCAEEYLLATSSSLPRMNQLVVEEILKYPRSGVHNYYWPRKGELVYDGCTTDVFYRGTKVMVGEPKARTYCCGLTLEVFYRVLGNIPSSRAVTEVIPPEKLKTLWFCTSIFAPGPGDAMRAAGVGKAVNPDEAMAGDFVQIWRNNRSGHSVIFVSWAYDQSGRRVGMHYWSTQEATDGIGFAVEAIGSSPAMINLDKTAFYRLLPPEEWK